MASHTMLSSNANLPRALLTRQSSGYTLTLEDLQNALNEPGKGYGSMNMDEFLKNICTGDERQGMVAAMPEGKIVRQASLQRQGSLSIPQNLAGKTVDEVWREIHRPADGKTAGKLQQRQMTLGEITLEEFLAKAGAVRQGSEADVSSSNNSSSSSVETHHTGIVRKAQVPAIQSINAHETPPQQQLDWLNYQVPHQHLLHQQHQHQQALVDASAFAAKSLLEPPFDTSVALGTLALSPSLAILSPDTPTRSRKRPIEVHEEKSVELRQRRMIKNRESAARSRARKQAYTVELEAEVTQLKEENAKLMQEQVETTEQRRKWLMKTLMPVTNEPQRPVRVLRRTQTTCW